VLLKWAVQVPSPFSSSSFHPPMSPRGKSTRSKKPVLSQPPPTQSSSRPAPRPLHRVTALPTTNEDKDRLVAEYHESYNRAEAFKNDVVAADAKSISKVGKAFDAALVSIRSSPILVHVLMSLIFRLTSLTWYPVWRPFHQAVGN
jgi:hypothetical protein